MMIVREFKKRKAVFALIDQDSNKTVKFNLSNLTEEANTDDIHELGEKIGTLCDTRYGYYSPYNVLTNSIYENN